MCACSRDMPDAVRGGRCACPRSRRHRGAEPPVRTPERANRPARCRQGRTRRAERHARHPGAVRACRRAARECPEAARIRGRRAGRWTQPRARLDPRANHRVGTDVPRQCRVGAGARHTRVQAEAFGRGRGCRGSAGHGVSVGAGGSGTGGGACRIGAGREIRTGTRIAPRPPHRPPHRPLDPKVPNHAEPRTGPCARTTLSGRLQPARGPTRRQASSA